MNSFVSAREEDQKQISWKMMIVLSIKVVNAFSVYVNSYLIYINHTIVYVNHKMIYLNLQNTYSYFFILVTHVLPVWKSKSKYFVSWGKSFCGLRKRLYDLYKSNMSLHKLKKHLLLLYWEQSSFFMKSVSDLLLLQKQNCSLSEMHFDHHDIFHLSLIHIWRCRRAL